ncbi:hypothetical protein NVP1081O_231 [Vibrio phage 1.081.O._10N.286.52.C2]|nr:hypothetical protein NVP1081O_231 [Vibrio phage 1.081.O._10N.286.52.C2]
MTILVAKAKNGLIGVVLAPVAITNDWKRMQTIAPKINEQWFNFRPFGGGSMSVQLSTVEVIGSISAEDAINRYNDECEYNHMKAPFKATILELTSK